MMNTEQEMRPCPFCGTSNKLKVTPYRADDDGGEPFDWGFTVICSALGFSHAPNRGCGASGAWGETEAEAIAAWNRRAPAVAAGGVTEAMVEAACAGFEHGVTQQTQDYQFKQLGDGWLFRSGDWINVSDALRAALLAALAVGDEGIREGWRHDPPFITSTSARPEYYVTVKVRDIKALHDAHDIVLRAFSEAVRLGGSNADQN